MEEKEFYKKVENYVKKLEKKEMIEFFSNIIRKIPKSKFEEVLCIMGSENINDEEIKAEIEKYKKEFKKIDEGELTFYAEQYEDYSRGWDDWCIDYTDSDNIGEIIDNCAKYAINLVNYKKYHFAKEIFDLIINANYESYDEMLEETVDISLSEIEENNFISVSVKDICLYMIYVIYQISNNKANDIYKFFKNNTIFEYIAIEDCFKLGTEKLVNLDEFYREWIELLSNKKGELEYRLLKEALIYTDYKNYKNYIENFIKNQPEIFIDIFKFLQESNNLEEIITLGNNVLKKLNKKYKVGSDIELYLANIDVKNKEKYICDSFNYNPSIMNLIRIINNGYFAKHEKDIKNKIESVKNEKDEDIFYRDKKTKYLLKFFAGDFEEFYNESIKYNSVLGWTDSFENISVQLWLLLLNSNEINTKSYSHIINDVFSYIGYCDNESEFLENDIETIWTKWKGNFKINEE